MLNKGMPIGEVSDKVNATEDVIREHYDKPDPVDELLERRIECSEQLDIGNQEDEHDILEAGHTVGRKYVEISTAEPC